MTTRPIGAEQREEIERGRRFARYCGSPQRPNRLANRIQDPVKQRFIDEFVSSHAYEGYPLVEEDVIDECETDVPARGLLRDVLVEQVKRAFGLARYGGEVAPEQVAADLLRSDCGALFTDLEHLPAAVLSPELVLGHLESLGFELPARVAVAVARRCFLLLITSGLERAP